MAIEQKQLRQVSAREDSILWSETSPLTVAVETRLGEVKTRHGRFAGGRADGVEVIEVDTGAVRVMLLPTRGMAIWYLEREHIRFGWDSPIEGPVHPSNVPVTDPTGLGWLEGFDELVARCGIESNGAPEHDADGRLIFPLHGRIGNLPADGLSIEIDEATGRVEVIGDVTESKLFFKRWRLRSRLRAFAGSADVEVLDDVTNALSTASEMQLLYHINVGRPVLDKGAKLHAAIAEIAPKDALSASEMPEWNEYGDAESGYSERVYFANLVADEHHRTQVLLASPDQNVGLGVAFGTKTLPNFVVWKNTGADNDGYVTGLEPATNFPNIRSYESEQGRVVAVPPGETVSFRLSLHPAITNAEVLDRIAEIESLAATAPEPLIHKDPRGGWTPM